MKMDNRRKALLILGIYLLATVALLWRLLRPGAGGKGAGIPLHHHLYLPGQHPDH